MSCAELDVLADALAAQPGCYGARMTGAGFGGSVVALIDAARVDTAVAARSACLRSALRQFSARIRRAIAGRREVARWLNDAAMH